MRHVCTQDDPWTREMGGRAEHPDAEYLRDEDHGDCDLAVYKCPWCGLTFKEELPQ